MADEHTSSPESPLSPEIQAVASEAELLRDALKRRTCVAWVVLALAGAAFVTSVIVLLGLDRQWLDSSCICGPGASYLLVKRGIAVASLLAFSGLMAKLAERLLVPIQYLNRPSETSQGITLSVTSEAASLLRAALRRADD